MTPWMKNLWGFFAALIVIFFIVIAAKAHEGHHITNSQYAVPQGDNVARPMEVGRFSGNYLYGRNRNDPALAMINCCKFGGDGDCRILDPATVKIVPGGYEWEGEFIAEGTATASPDDNFYGCKHPGATAHCFHVPPQGF